MDCHPDATRLWYNPVMDIPVTIPPELWLAVERAGVEPVLLEGPETMTDSLVIKRDVYERLPTLLTVERVDRSLYEFAEFPPYE